MCARVHACVCACMYVCVCMYVHTCVYVYMCECTNDTSKTASSSCYIQNREDQQWQRVQGPVLPGVREVEEVEDKGGDDVQKDRVKQQTCCHLLLSLLVLAPAPL